MDNATVLVTGGNSGIGYECARALALAGRHVVIASRDQRSTDDAVARISAERGAGRIEGKTLDLSSPASIRRFVADIEARDLSLQSLVCNAGLQFASGPVLTAEGYETTFAVNHLGHFLLTNLLLSRLSSRAPSRVVIVSSGVHDGTRFTGMPKPKIGDLETLAVTGGATPGAFSGPVAYVNSKVCNLWFGYELARRIEAAGLSDKNRPIAINCFDPGLVPGSGLARAYHPAARFIWSSVMPAMAAGLTTVIPGISTAKKSGSALAHLVLEPSLGASGARYYPSHTRWEETPSSPQSYDEVRARELWEASVQMTGLTRDESPLAA